jgi:SAM-dependent methyltransferase
MARELADAEDAGDGADGDVLYGALASWWPMLSPVEDYEEEAALLAGLLASASIPVRTVLELGSGGGHNASYLRHRFDLTLVDRSPGMLAVSQALNPDLRHLQGDMRTLRLPDRFDAVLVHDAIDYCRTPDDLAATLATAAWHCRPGGTVVLAPDDVADTFAPATEHGGSDGLDGRAARYLAWSWDPDPSDTVVRTEYAILLREADGSVEAVRATDDTGCFPRATWHQLLDAAGFDPTAVLEDAHAAFEEDRVPRTFFVGHRRPSATD